MKITIPLNPVPASRPRVTRWGVYYGKKHTQYNKDCKMLLKQCQKPKTTAQTVLLKFYIEIPKSKSKAFKNENNNEPHLQKPDIDNLAKLIIDILVDKNYFSDDNIIVKLVLEKFWTLENPRTEVIIKDYEK